jgi:hypothetical protein
MLIRYSPDTPSTPPWRRWFLIGAIVMVVISSPILSHGGAAQSDAPLPGSLQIALLSSTGGDLNSGCAHWRSGNS